MDIVRVINFSFQIWGSILTLLLIACLLISNRNKTISDHLFLTVLILNTAVMIFDALALVFRGAEGIFVHDILVVMNLFQFLSSFSLARFYGKYLEAYINEKNKGKVKLFYGHFMLGIYVLGIVLLVFNLFHPFLYEINSQNLYVRLDWYPLITTIGSAILLISFYMVVSYRKTLTKTEFICFVIYFFAPLLGIVLSSIFFDIVYAQIATTFSICVMFLLLHSEQNKILIRKEQEINQSKIDIALSQIQPHFLCNTLGTLGELCKTDPETASKAIDEFTVYLRVNLDSMKQHIPVSFKKELEHVKTYINLEKLRFQDDIDITYDLQVMDFNVPTLTIQPLVENAIKHGMMGREGVCHIALITRQVGDEVEIVIKDDGVGFDQNQQYSSNRTHVGIDNVRNRIESISNGTMKVESISEVGTKVTIRIPMNQK